ncbi:hypothetical protein V8C35DRAFT_281067 [Trichoderma chlorosporum]
MALKIGRKNMSECSLVLVPSATLDKSSTVRIAREPILRLGQRSPAARSLLLETSRRWSHGFQRGQSQANVFAKAAITFVLLFNKDSSHYDYRLEAPTGWAPCEPSSTQYEMKDLKLKSEELRKEVVREKLLIKAREARVTQNEANLQH